MNVGIKAIVPKLQLKSNVEDHLKKIFEKMKVIFQVFIHILISSLESVYQYSDTSWKISSKIVNF